MEDTTATLETPVSTGASLDSGAQPDISGAGTPPPTEPTVETQPTEEPEQQPGQKGEDLSEFGSMVSSRLREYTKKSPDLAAAMQKDPNLKNSLEGVFRRDAAYRELYPTVAEARSMREAFPNGMADVQQLMATAQEIEQLDARIADKGPNGDYPGHREVLRDIWSENRESAVALMRTSIREWSREDPDSYSSVLASVIGSTFQTDGIPGFVSNLKLLASEIKNPMLTKAIDEFEGYVGRFLQDPSKARQDSPEAQRIKADREQLAKDRAAADKSSMAQFSSGLNQQVQSMQAGVIRGHSLIKQLAKSVPADKLNRVVSEIQKRLHEKIGKNAAFVRNFNAKFNAKDGNGCIELGRKMCSEPYVLNPVIRQVLSEEGPGLTRTAGPTRPAAPKAPAADAKPTRPYQIGKQWFHADGRKMSYAETLAGIHMAS